VTLYVFDNVLRHNLAFEPPQGILQRFAFLQSNFRHSHHLQSQLHELFPLAYSLCATRGQTQPKLVAKCQDYVLFAVNTGLRPDEAWRLQFRDVTIVFRRQLKKDNLGDRDSRKALDWTLQKYARCSVAF
jgi:integrase